VKFLHLLPVKRAKALSFLKEQGPIWQGSGDIIACAIGMLQFSSEMQQTWHIYRPRDQLSETGLKILILFLTGPLSAP
jgi:hypothetical protein